jgi:hypothetical protein
MLQYEAIINYMHTGKWWRIAAATFAVGNATAASPELVCYVHQGHSFLNAARSQQRHL